MPVAKNARTATALADQMRKLVTNGQVLTAPVTFWQSKNNDPFTCQLPANLEKVVDIQAKCLKSSGVDGVFAVGTTGETATMTLDEKLRLGKSWVQACDKHGLSIILHIGGSAPQDSLALAEQVAAWDLQPDALATLPPLYHKPIGLQGIVDYLKAISERASDIPLMYYHIPMMTHYDFRYSDLIKAAFPVSGKPEVSTFYGAKYTHIDMEDLSRTFAHLSKSNMDKDHFVWIGSDTNMVGAKAAGTCGAMTMSSNTPFFARRLADEYAGKLNDDQVMEHRRWLHEIEDIAAAENVSIFAAYKYLASLAVNKELKAAGEELVTPLMRAPQESFDGANSNRWRSSVVFGKMDA
eukprot:Clim_evm2s53 gene=Clim_evmTU2s53